MAAFIPDGKCFVIASLIFFLLIKTEQAISGTSAATSMVMEPHWAELVRSTVLEHMPLDREVVGSIPARCWAFFSSLSNQ